jgi:hypothetical protein
MCDVTCLVRGLCVFLYRNHDLFDVNRSPYDLPASPRNYVYDCGGVIHLSRAERKGFCQARRDKR